MSGKKIGYLFQVYYFIPLKEDCGLFYTGINNNKYILKNQLFFQAKIDFQDKGEQKPKLFSCVLLIFYSSHEIIWQLLAINVLYIQFIQSLWNHWNEYFRTIRYLIMRSMGKK